jgi:hypothetical protein
MMRTGKVLFVMVAVLAMAGAAGAQMGPTPFECTGEAYTVRGNPTQAQLYLIDQSGSPFIFVEVGSGATLSSCPADLPSGATCTPGQAIQLNNLGYNTVDDLLYAVAMPLSGNYNYGIVQIDSTGAVFPLGYPGTPWPKTVRLLAGDVDPAGDVMYVTTYPSGTLYTVDLGTGAVSSVSTSQSVWVADWTVNPLDGMLYGGAGEKNCTYPNPGLVYRLDPSNGEIADLGEVTGLPCYDGSGDPERYYGGSWFKSNGTLVLYRNVDWIYEVNITTNPPTLVDDFAGTAVTSSLNDAAACAAGPDVFIDVKPQSDPNCFNVNGSGVIPVAILGSDSFDVYDVDVSTLLFNGSDVQVRGKKDKTMCHYEDVSGDFVTYPTGGPDGYLDLVCQFEDDPTQWTTGQSEATLMGSLLDGTPFEATDEVCITQDVP